MHVCSYPRRPEGGTGSLGAGVVNYELAEISLGTDPGSSALNHRSTLQPPLPSLLLFPVCFTPVAVVAGEEAQNARYHRISATRQAPFIILFWTGSHN